MRLDRKTHPKGAVLCVSDIHLEHSEPERMAQFCAFLSERAVTASALYILGDWFTAWPGDEYVDIHRDFFDPMLAALKVLQDKGIPVYALHGNHDFLMGTWWAEQVGIQWLSEESLLHVAGKSWCLLHGDTLCLADVAYQAFRKMVREPRWQQGFLSLPLANRLDEIERVRGLSNEEKALKAAGIMDVSLSAVLDVWSRYPECAGMIHGHTHRPAFHKYRQNDRVYTRWVLPDWIRAAGYGVLTDRAEAFTLYL
jgi:UDP-2,3-diacylglucosamine hydrolase